jgi:hypothetical protein
MVGRAGVSWDFSSFLGSDSLQILPVSLGSRAGGLEGLPRDPKALPMVLSELKASFLSFSKGSENWALETPGCYRSHGR